MPQLLTPETFEFFVRYLLAGFVFTAVRSWFVSGDRPKLNEVLVESVILSLINQVIALMTFAWMTQDWVSAHPSFSIVLPNVVQPAILGAFFGWIAGMDAVPPGLRRLIMPTVRPVNPSFDYAFDQLGGPSFVILGFADGKQVLGYFGSQSMVGSSAEASSIFLEELYVIGEDQTWESAEPPRSGWVSLRDVRSIEFIATEESDHGQDPL